MNEIDNFLFDFYCSKCRLYSDGVCDAAACLHAPEIVDSAVMAAFDQCFKAKEEIKEYCKPVEQDSECCTYCQYKETCEREPEQLWDCQCEHHFIRDVLENGSYMDDVHRFILEEYDDQ